MNDNSLQDTSKYLCIEQQLYYIYYCTLIFLSYYLVMKIIADFPTLLWDLRENIYIYAASLRE